MISCPYQIPPEFSICPSLEPKQDEFQFLLSSQECACAFVCMHTHFGVWTRPLYMFDFLSTVPIISYAEPEAGGQEVAVCGKPRSPTHAPGLDHRSFPLTYPSPTSSSDVLIQGLDNLPVNIDGELPPSQLLLSTTVSQSLTCTYISLNSSFQFTWSGEAARICISITHPGVRRCCCVISPLWSPLSVAGLKAQAEERTGKCTSAGTQVKGLALRNHREVGNTRGQAGGGKGLQRQMAGKPFPTLPLRTQSCFSRGTLLNEAHSKSEKRVRS